MSEHIERLLSEYIDEELEPAEHRTVERHLAECPSCRKAWLDLLAVQTGVKAQFAAMKVPDGLQAAIMSKLEGMPDEAEAADAPAAEAVPAGEPWRGTGPLKGLMLMLFVFAVIVFVLFKGFVAGFLHFGLSLLHAGTVLMTAVPYVTESVVLFVLAAVSLSGVTLIRVFRTKLN